MSHHEFTGIHFNELKVDAVNKNNKKPGTRLKPCPLKGGFTRWQEP